MFNEITEYRPAKFEDLVGRNNIVATLKTMLKDVSKYPKVTLLHGYTGTGKTTLAKIIANELAVPANIIEISKVYLQSKYGNGMSVPDMIAKEAAEVWVAPIFNKGSLLDRNKRVVIIDEVQEFTQTALTQLLTLLEDTVDNLGFLHFILCTTKVSKLPTSLISRATANFELLPLTYSNIEDILKRFIKKYAIQCSDTKLNELSTSANGSARLAISLLTSSLSIQNGIYTVTEDTKIVSYDDSDEEVPTQNEKLFVNMMVYGIYKKEGATNKFLGNRSFETPQVIDLYLELRKLEENGVTFETIEAIFFNTIKSLLSTKSKSSNKTREALQNKNSSNHKTLLKHIQSLFGLMSTTSNYNQLYNNIGKYYSQF